MAPSTEQYSWQKLLTTLYPHRMIFRFMKEQVPVPSTVRRADAEAAGAS